MKIEATKKETQQILTSTSRTRRLTVSPKIATGRVDLHKFGWSGVLCRPTASRGTHDYRWREAPECMSRARFVSDECGGIVRDRVSVPANSYSRVINNSAHRRVVPRSRLRPRSIRCRQSARSESAIQPAPARRDSVAIFRTFWQAPRSLARREEVQETTTTASPPTPGLRRTIIARPRV